MQAKRLLMLVDLPSPFLSSGKWRSKDKKLLLTSDEFETQTGDMVDDDNDD